jgi:hypothetical protein
VGVGVDTQFVLDRLGEVAPSDVVEVFEQRLESPYHERESGQDHELGPHVGDAEPRQERVFSPDHDVDGAADEDLRSESMILLRTEYTDEVISRPLWGRA